MLYKKKVVDFVNFDMKISEFLNNLNYDKTRVLDFSSGFFYYKDFPVCRILKDLMKKNMEIDGFFDYLSDDFFELLQYVISLRYNLYGEFIEDLNLNDVFITWGTFHWFQILKNSFDLFFKSKKKILLIVPNFWDSLNTLFNVDDDIYIYDYIKYWEEYINYIRNDFDVCLIEDPLWPQGFYVSNNFLKKLWNICKFVVVDKSLDSYRYKDIGRKGYQNNFIVVNSLSKEFGITFKWYLISRNEKLNKFLLYSYNSFWFSSQLYLFVLLFVNLFKIWIKNKDIISKVLFSYKDILDKFLITDFIDSNYFNELSDCLRNNKNRFIFRRKFLFGLFQRTEWIIKIFENHAGMNLLIWFKKIPYVDYNKFYQLLVENGIVLSYLYFPILYDDIGDYYLFRLNISSWDTKWFIIFVNRLEKFVKKIYYK